MEKEQMELDMDDIFKDTYVNHFIFYLQNVEPYRPLTVLNHIWEDVDDLINQRRLFLGFALDCDEFGLPAVFTMLNQRLKKQSLNGSLNSCKECILK